MEALSPTMEEGQVVKWLKSEGDKVASGDLLAEIETDKATMELAARGDGVLRAILVEEGGTAPVGKVIAVIAGSGEDVSEFTSGVATSPAEGRAALVKPPAAPGTATTEAPPTRPPGGGRIKASPLARRLASASGLDLAAVRGSGPAGRIVKHDIETALAEGGARARSPGTSGPPSLAEYEDVPLTQMRKTIARRLVESLSPVPHFFLTVEVDMARAQEARKSINELLKPEGQRISLNDLVVRATAAALRRHPDCNAHWLGDSVRRFNRVHLGVAVAVEDGLITPVVRDADTKGVARIGEELRDMAQRARAKKLQPAEYTGATFSISNLGMFGIHEFTAVINPPEAGILAIGGVEELPVVKDGQVVVGSRMRVTMSCDHRVIDGATGARFLATLKDMLEEPAAILV